VARSLFITGTDTGIGKTTVASALAAALWRREIDVRVTKPVETGCSEDARGTLIPADALQLRWAAGRESDPLHVVCPFRFREPLAPSVAAARAGARLELAAIADAVRSLMRSSGLTLVEGAGGLAVPLTADATFADLARACDLRVLVVVGNRLGAINHARLTVDWVARAGLELAGYVINALGPDHDLATETNVEVLHDVLGPPLGAFPFIGRLSRTDEDRLRLADVAEQTLDIGRLLD
jgi:dethiobiotin synthetase